MSARIIRLIDRSRHEALEECPRLRFLNYDFDGEGIEPESGALPLIAGIAIHNAHARLLGGEALELVLASTVAAYRDELAVKFTVAVPPGFLAEQAALLEGMLRAWAYVRLPRLLEEYDVVSIEQTWDWELAPGLVQRLRMDAILRRKADGELFILDYKTVSYPSEVWQEKFEHNLQTCLYIRALQERTGEHVGGILYEGLVKGLFRKDTSTYSPFYGQKVQSSPYTIAYALTTDGVSLFRTEYTSRKGWRKVRPYEHMPMRAWVENYLIPGGEGFAPLNEQFVVVPQILPADYELERMKDQVVREELEYFERLDRYRAAEAAGADEGTLARMRDQMFPYRTGRCYKFGADYACKFVPVCFIDGFDPLDVANGFVKRKPHHDTDLEMVA